ncbi:hypothetical protein IEQ11_15550 [Lysobacter capsici]|uniref:hypothetical protein n=1 Tax=Lysobacter capsici TaxID=435897 RepID=UPI001781C2BA|nr:hypothetical protein [Lysobacter capsici]UOF13164.1 hypothetical protein IEQ11_15550 [Lysobacter capsici]
MNRRPDAPDPLSPEERELAQRLLRLGPSDGPSPALDARILAAAHAAVATTQQPRLRVQPRQRWPMWIGVAASLCLAVGIAWQLRPAATKMEAVQQEQDAAVVARAQAEPVADSGGAQSDEIQADAAAAAPAPAAASVAAPAKPTEAMPGADMAADSVADAVAPAAMTPAPVTAQSAPPASSAPPKAIAEEGEAAKRSRAETPASAQAAAATEARVSIRRVQVPPAERELKSAPAMAPPPPPAPSAPMGVMSAPVPVDAAANAGWASPADNLSSKRAAKAAAVAADAATLGKAEAYSERADVQAAPEPSSKSSNASPTLDRIEVTGSRIGNDASDESRLAPAEWLDRIRGYRDDGQAERARESLQRFRRAHPHTRVPDDLRALLK